jgi:hypothetical protein
MKACKLIAVCSLILLSGFSAEYAVAGGNKANYPFGGHVFNVSSGVFDNEAICSVELDDMHPREYQITVETVTRPSFMDFTKTFNDVKRRCRGVKFKDSNGNISSEPKRTTDDIYRFEANCFRGTGKVEGLYDSRRKYYRYVVIYDMDDQMVQRLAGKGIIKHMETVLRKTCPFYR